MCWHGPGPSLMNMSNRYQIWPDMGIGVVSSNPSGFALKPWTHTVATIPAIPLILWTQEQENRDLSYCDSYSSPTENKERNSNWCFKDTLSTRNQQYQYESDWIVDSKPVRGIKAWTETPHCLCFTHAREYRVSSYSRCIHYTPTIHG